MANNDPIILINASFPGETRVAQIEKQNEKLYNLTNLTIEQRDKTDIQGNIYLGRVVQIAGQRDAAWVDIGEVKKGFLPYDNLSPPLLGREHSATSRETRMSEILKVEEKLIVQVRTNKRHNEEKGTTLTCKIKFSGEGLVLIPNHSRHGKSIPENLSESVKKRCLENLKRTTIPKDADNLAIIVEKSGLHMTPKELQAEINALTSLWNKVKSAFLKAKVPGLLLREPALPWRIIRDHLNSKTDQILVDDEELYQQLKDLGDNIRPDNSNKIKLHSEKTPIFSHFGIDQQVANTFQRLIKLPSGGSVVIDHTEQLTRIDVNSGQEKKGNMEKTAVATNKEALTEIARQLRLRYIGGQIVINLIQMEIKEKQNEILSEFSKSMSVEGASINIGDIDERGLLILNRKRLSTMADSFMVPLVQCSQCHGSGRLETPAAMSSRILRKFENEFAKGNDAANRNDKDEQYTIDVPLEVSSYLMNHKRDTVTALEHRYHVNLTIVPKPALNIPNFKIRKSNKHTDNVNHMQHSEKQQGFNNQQAPTTQRTAPLDSNPSYSRADRRHSLINKLLKLFGIG